MLPGWLPVCPRLQCFFLYILFEKEIIFIPALSTEDNSHSHWTTLSLMPICEPVIEARKIEHSDRQNLSHELRNKSCEVNFPWNHMVHQWKWRLLRKDEGGMLDPAKVFSEWTGSLGLQRCGSKKHSSGDIAHGGGEHRSRNMEDVDELSCVCRACKTSRGRCQLGSCIIQPEA